MYVRKLRECDFRQLCSLVILYQPTYHSGIIKYSRLSALAQHFLQFAFENLCSVAFYHVREQGWGLIFAHGWQLCCVADKHQSAVFAREYILHEVIEQRTRSETCLACWHGRNHRSLVHHEESVGMIVEIQIEIALECLLPVYLTVDSGSRKPSIERDDLCRSARRSHQHDSLSQ